MSLWLRASLVAILGCSPRTEPEPSQETAADTTCTVDEAVVEPAVPYRTVDGVVLTADLTIPAGEGPFPVVVLLHGGAFSGGDSEDLEPWALALQDAGFASLSADYRLVCDGPEDTGCTWETGEQAHPGPVEDVKCAVRWLRGVAEERCLDPDRITMMGGSAGAFLASFAATTADAPRFSLEGCAADGGSDAVAGVVAYYGISSWNALRDARAEDEWKGDGLSPSEQVILGSDCTDKADRNGICTTASPIAQLDASDPPFLLLHGVDDRVIPVGQSRRFEAALQEVGIPVAYRESEDVGHGWMAHFEATEPAAARDEALAWLEALHP